MDDLETLVCLKIKDIVEKLHKLDCTLLGNKDDSWIMELLFKPGLHRINLIEWAISKFMPLEPQDSAKDRVQKLKLIISDMGICRENISDIVEGTAVLNDQLQFWSTLVDIMWLKYETALTVSKRNSDFSMSPEKSVKRIISEEFQKACSSVAIFCESGYMQHIFMHDLPLLAPDVQREIEKKLSSESEMLDISSQQQLGKLAEEDVLSEIYKNLCTNKIPIDEVKDGDAEAETELNKLECELHEVVTDLQNVAQGAFIDSHNSLKHLIAKANAEDSVDVGPAFQNVEPVLDDFLQLTKSFPELELTNSALSKMNSELEDLLNQDTLADENYTNTYKAIER